MIITYLAEYRSKQANKLRNKLPCIKKNSECWSFFRGIYPYAIIKDKFKDKCIE